MGFLKTFGDIVLKGAAIATIVQPLLPPGPVSGTITAVTGGLAQIVNIIGMVEVSGQALQLGGAQKLVMATPLVSQVIMQSPFMIGKVIKDSAKFNKAVEGIASNMADLLNSLHEDGVKGMQ
jgi:hypothetical protein